jgi:putative SOS response-associated peptidase YedK
MLFARARTRFGYMCGRATLTNSDIDQVLRELDAELASDDAKLFRPRYNIAPSDTHWIVEPKDEHRVLVPAVWGYLASGRSLINVRGETVASGGGFRKAFGSRRCVLVTDGFYEWDKRRSPFWYHRPDGGLVLLAGLYQPPPPAEVQALQSPPAHGAAPQSSKTGPAFPRFTLLTTSPNQLVAKVHNRMPVIISQERLDDWLTATPEIASNLIQAAPENLLVATPVSRRVNSVKNDDIGCLQPGEPAPRQSELF